MNTPDWTTAPDWAKYHTVDDDGIQRYHENKPIYSPKTHDWYSHGNREIILIDGMGTLTERPK